MLAHAHLTARPRGPVDNGRAAAATRTTLPGMQFEPAPDARFLTLDQVAGELNISRAQAYALVRRRELLAIKVGGRGQWRVERARLEEYITGAYAETARWLEQSPEADEPPLEDDDPPAPDASAG